MRCGWCETNNPTTETQCVGCGGPLQHPGATRGPAPAEAPRAIPARFVRRTRRTALGFGAAFAAVGAGVSLLFLIAGLLLPLMFSGLLIGLPLTAVGALLARHGLRQAEARLDLLRNGTPAEGRVVELKTGSSGGWLLHYTFEADGETRSGQIATADAEITRFQPGDPLWIVSARAACEIWPPIP